MKTQFLDFPLPWRESGVVSLSNEARVRGNDAFPSRERIEVRVNASLHLWKGTG
jgi:hypothetical protein